MVLATTLAILVARASHTAAVTLVILLITTIALAFH